MKINRFALALVAVLSIPLAAAILLYSCSGNGGSALTGQVALYATDDLSDYQQVLVTINRIDLVNSGSGVSCNVFTGPLTLDLPGLAGVTQLITIGACPAASYNRIHIEFARSVELMNLADAAATCQFDSYKDDHNAINRLSCGTDSCSLDITGAVNALVREPSKLALDFNLKEFEVENFSSQACSVTMKVSPLHGSELEARGNPEGVTGLVSGLATTNRTFTLSRGARPFTVLYGAVTTTLQPGIDILLQRAQDDGLRVKALASQIDLATSTITASAVYVKMEGTIAAGSLSTTNQTFTIMYRGGRTMDVDYGSATVEGILAEGGWVDVKLSGFDGTRFLARTVEVSAEGTITDN